MLLIVAKFDFYRSFVPDILFPTPASHFLQTSVVWLTDPWELVLVTATRVTWLPLRCPFTYGNCLLQAFSANSKTRTVKIGSEEALDDEYEQHICQPVYEPFGSTEFNDLLEEVTELVHSQHERANKAAAAAAAAAAANDDVVIMLETPARAASHESGTQHTQKRGIM